VVTAERARLFVALDLPAFVRGELAAWGREAVGGEPGVRPLAAESLHVTLCFLGWRELAQAQDVGEAALACARPVPALATAQAAWLPPRRPSVLVVDLEGDGAIAEMQSCVVESLVAAAGYEPEARPFRPHVTVARLRRGTRRPKAELPSPPRLAFAGESLTLYRSQLRRGGARYEPLARVGL
jgi:RNA 2',3'-cyclic 3'-phosphodiesterase